MVGREAWAVAGPVLANAAGDGIRTAALLWKAAAWLHEGNRAKAFEVLAERRRISEEKSDWVTISGDDGLIGRTLLDLGDVKGATARFASAVEAIEKADVPEGVKEATRRNHIYNQALVALGFADSVSFHVALGTAIAVIVPTAVLGTWRNRRNGNADLPVAGVVGLAGIVSAFAASKVSVGMSAGLTRVRAEEFDGTGGRERNSETRPSLGVIVDYNWILGRTRRFVVGTGVGAKRIFGLDDDFIDANVGYPTARFQVGFLF